MKKITLFICFLITSVQAQNLKTDMLLSFGSIADDALQSTVTDDSGNLYLTGFYFGTIDVDPEKSVYNLTSNGSTDVFIIKLSPLKKLIWAKSIGGIGEDGSYKICLDKNDNLFITGVFENSVDFDPSSGQSILSSNGYYDVFVIKMKTNGGFLWAKSFGGFDDEYIRDMVLGKSGEIILTGSFNGNVDFDPSSLMNSLTSNGYDIFISKLDANGNFISVIKIGGVSQDFAKCLSIDDSANLYISGTFAQTVDFDPGAATFNLTSNGMNDIFLLKLKSSGDFVWAYSFGGVLNDDIRTIKVLNGNLYVSGWNMSKCDFDPGSGIINYTPVGAIDLFISKFSLNGNLLWVRNAGGIGSELIDDIATDSNGDLYLTGYFTENLKIKINNDSVSLMSNGFRNILFIKMNALGDFIWASEFGSNSTDYGTDILISSDDQITLCGAFSNSVNFDKSGGVNLAESKGATDIFIVSFTDNTTGVKLFLEENKNITIFPNPSNGRVNITCDDFNKLKFIEIYDINGIFINRIVFDGLTSQFNLIDLADSIYFFKIFTYDGDISYQKWIKINQ